MPSTSFLRLYSSHAGMFSGGVGSVFSAGGHGAGARSIRQNRTKYTKEDAGAKKNIIRNEPDLFTCKNKYHSRERGKEGVFCVDVIPGSDQQPVMPSFLTGISDLACCLKVDMQ
jgi:hypothetical protein